MDTVHVTDRRIPSLDGVRGLAILIVLIHNASLILGPSDHLVMKLLSTATATGWIGVQLFFVLSGFLITGILLDTRESETYFRSFYVRRVLRIFPLYYAFLAMAFWVFPAFADPDWVTSVHRHQIWYWTYMSNWRGPLGISGVEGLSHMWSLAVEEQFYLLWPLAVFGLTRPSLGKVCLGALVLTPFIRSSLLMAGLPPSAAYTFTVARWDALAGGALLAILMAQGPGRSRTISRADTIGVVALGIFVGVVLIARGFGEQNPVVQIVGQSMTVLLCAWLLLVAIAPRSRPQEALRAYLRAPWLRFLGKCSYAIYVFHFPVHILAAYYLGDTINGPDNLWRIARWAGYVGAVSVISTLLAVASWHLLEKHFLSLKDRLAPRGVATSS